MIKVSYKDLMMLALSVSLVIGAMLIGGCVGKRARPQISESITVQEAFTLIQENQDNPSFVIVDIQTPEAFAQEHIENAININYRSEDFQKELGKLDKNKIYLIYYNCNCGGIDKKALNMMKELGFMEVYKISGGLDWWKEEELPTIQITPSR